MIWIDIASIVFVCVTMNHLGLIGKIEEICGKLPIIHCPKCCSFWTTLLYGLCGIDSLYGELPIVLAVSFLASYSAIWLELLEGYIDVLYLKCYDKIYTTKADTSATDTVGSNSSGSMS